MLKLPRRELVFCTRIGEENGEGVCDLDADDTRLGEENGEALFMDALNNRLLIGEDKDDNDLLLPSLCIIRCRLLILFTFTEGGEVLDD